jgi:hypothetical protein
MLQLPPVIMIRQTRQLLLSLLLMLVPHPTLTKKVGRVYPRLLLLLLMLKLLRVSPQQQQRVSLLLLPFLETCKTHNGPGKPA